MNTDAHAWTEAYFPTFGWLRFEPTPSGQGTAHATNYMSTASGTGHIFTGVPIISATAAPGPQSAAGPVNTLSGKSAGTPWAAIALAVIAAIALACGVIAMVAPPAQRAVS